MRLLRAISALVPLLATAALPARPAAAQSEVLAAQRILSVKLLEVDERKQRIEVHLSDLPGDYTVVDPRPGRPLQIQVPRTAVDPSIRAEPSSTRLVRNVWIRPSDSGFVIIEAALATSQVTVRHFSLAGPPARIVVQLDLKRDIQLPSGAGSSPAGSAEAGAERLSEPTEATSPSAALSPGPTVRPAIPTAAPTAPADAEAVAAALPDGQRGFEPAIALPAPPARGTGRSGVAVSRGISSPSPSPTVRAVPTESPEVQELRRYNFFPFREVLKRLSFPGAEALARAYVNNQFLEAHRIGADALQTPQSRESLAALLYVLAECRFQLARSRTLDAEIDEVKDWQGALNYYWQAAVYDPQSDLRPFADYRMSQMCGSLGRLVEQDGLLRRVRSGRDFAAMPNAAEILREHGILSLLLYNLSPYSDRYLEQAREAFQQIANEHPDVPFLPEAHLFLGEAQFTKKDYAAAYNSYYEGLRELQRRNLTLISASSSAFPAMIPHFGFSAHYQGKVDLAYGDSEQEEVFVREISSSTLPEVRLEYARLLAKRAGETGDGELRRRATVSFDYVARHPGATPRQVHEARLGIVDHAIEDLARGRVDPECLVEDYMQPRKALQEVMGRTYDLGERAGLLAREARYLIETGKPVEALRMILPHLRAGDLPPEAADELRGIISDRLMEILDHARREQDHFLALQIYEGFEDFLQSHSLHDEILVGCAEVLIEGGYRDAARSALGRVQSYASLPAGKQATFGLLQQELQLDPSDRESVKVYAPQLLKPGVNDYTRGRVLDLLIDTYAAEGNHDYAAQLCFQIGSTLTDLPGERRMAYYLRAADEYSEAGAYGTVTEVLLAGMRDFESTGVEILTAEKPYGEMLRFLGENYNRQNEHEEAVMALQQYTDLYPEGEKVHTAYYLLGKSFEALGRRHDALTAYEALAGMSDRNGLWARYGREAAELLRAQIENPALQDTENTP